LLFVSPVRKRNISIIATLAAGYVPLFPFWGSKPFGE
jgi:hypothetical protein